MRLPSTIQFFVAQFFHSHHCINSWSEHSFFDKTESSINVVDLTSVQRRCQWQMMRLGPALRCVRSPFCSFVESTRKNSSKNAPLSASARLHAAHVNQWSQIDACALSTHSLWGVRQLHGLVVVLRRILVQCNECSSTNCSVDTQWRWNAYLLYLNFECNRMKSLEKYGCKSSM